MSVQVMSWVLEESETRGEERLVLLAIANHASAEDAQAYPSIGKLAQEANVHPDTAKRIVRKLHRDGHITRETQAAPDERIPAHKRPNLYTIHLDHETIRKLREIRDIPPPELGDDASRGEGLSLGDDTSPGDAATREGGVTASRGTGGCNVPPNHHLEPSLNHQSRATFTRKALEDEFEVWWKRYPRKVNKAPALKAYKARRRAGVAADALLTAVDRYAEVVRDKEADFIKHGTTFLNNGWDEWLPGGAADEEAKGRGRHTETTSEIRARLEKERAR